jgi:hypothetical protein
MQFSTNNDDFYRLFNSVRCGDRLVIIPTRTDTNPKGWNNEPESPACIRGDESIHLLVSYVDPYSSVILDDDENQILFGDPAFPENNPESYPNKSEYYILDGYFMNEGTDTTWNKRFCLVADFMEQTNSWKFRLDVYNNVDDYHQFNRISMYLSIYKMVLCSGAKSVIPVLCAKECAKRTMLRVEKTTFSSVLARRFGDTLANDLAEMMFLGKNKCALETYVNK